MNTLEIARHVVNTLEDKKGENILLLDIHDITSFTDYFVICNGTSDRMLDALASAVSQSVKDTFRIISQPEGHSAFGWVVLDLGDVVLHLFSPEQREYYRLEELWSQGKVLLRLQ